MSLVTLSYCSPMKRLIENTVRLGLVIAWRLAGSPTLRSPFSVNATTDGVVRCPSELGMTTGSLPSITATHELVVPKSMPMILLIIVNVYLLLLFPFSFRPAGRRRIEQRLYQKKNASFLRRINPLRLSKPYFRLTFGCHFGRPGIAGCLPATRCLQKGRRRSLPFRQE